MEVLLAILPVIAKLLELIIWVIRQWEKWDAFKREQFKQFLKDLNATAANIKSQMRGALNEDTYMQQNTQLKNLQYTAIRGRIIEILRTGAGINDLKLIPEMRIGALISVKENEILNILVGQLDYIEKAQSMAKILVELL